MNVLGSDFTAEVDVGRKMFGVHKLEDVTDQMDNLSSVIARAQTLKPRKAKT